MGTNELEKSFNTRIPIRKLPEVIVFYCILHNEHSLSNSP
ncbi:hypothetical protein LEP1GSC103_2921 [Leptospira borgpetersenii serovar Javanica str. UI 09931]|uniref:Uncharacterized protein n=3 Tax=Leptospira borgpetersenii TaxID=174 RepID=M3FI47_LEPBO|nr:hypothetical protein LEP1GSC128_3167 [Leptospira borgpetersenii str. 200801926]EKQ92081.1 hypothetical protein LEP1GSC101_3265 [Leptospira borgpetersenii str. UI 09149]EMG01493.1 hypothetical protein LEP1GSC123_4479 [Leptospira borgpetersenii str. 200701203]EMN59367.1 hypothetical protein LEP1GSC090_1332 [Leptospira borgpetersenii serovar Javanica str. MK146]ENO62527.1 hypothetical protein LEP1GSC191_3761 [Leptospira borgpetersenii serovar Mini str. 201000851]EPG57575.1 hypothetical protein